MSDERIDWKAVHRRLEATGDAIKKEFSPGPGERKKILRARADLLARRPAGKQDEGTVEVVEFLLANERYGIESGYVREVYPLKDYTPLPCTPAFVLGLVNVRGRVVSVVDIRKFFELPEKGISDLNKVIIIHGGSMEFGILADSILGVRNIATTDIQPPLPTLTGIREEFLRGITTERLAVLDAQKLLAHKNIVVHEEV